MVTMLHLPSVFVAAAVLALQLCVGEKSCDIRSSAGDVVERGSSFDMFCTFNWECKGACKVYSGHPPTKQSHIELNSTTICFKVVNITENRTYSCRCDDCVELDPCGMDISAGYLPDHPKNISCIHKILKNESGVVVCTWNKGRDTYLRNSSTLWVRTDSGNHSSYTLSNKAAQLLSANITVSRSARLISVWVQTENALGSAESSIINYTLSDIAMPVTPVLSKSKCYSRRCIITVEQSVRTQHLEIQYRAEQQTWTSYPDSLRSFNTSPFENVVQMNSSLWCVSSLEPYRLYHFRARSKFSTGLWSQWSTIISNWTQEEAPSNELDVWFAELASDFKSIRVYWKDANISIARGKIIGYELSVSSPNYHVNVSADARSYKVELCASCEVTVSARNSKGLSPPARITTRRTEVKPRQDVQVTAGNYSVTISWTKPKTAPLPASYVLEWYPEGNKVEELRWVRLSKNKTHTLISDIKPLECYEGAVYVFYNESSFSRTRFKGVATLELAPEAGPVPQETVEGKNIKITWTELPWNQRRGCITKYTIYLSNSSGYRTSHSIPAEQRMYMIKNLAPDDYNLWMSASTAGGEGPLGQKIKFFIEPDTELLLLLLCVAASLIVLFLLCLYQNSTVKQKFWELFQCFMLDVVPDPANSKWAREYVQNKDKMNLQPLQSSVPREEEKLILVDVEELPKQNSDTAASTNIFSHLLPQTSLSPETEAVILQYPLTTYIKSLSHDSDSSYHTETSVDTTVDYISSHGPGNMDEEDQEDKGEELIDIHFFPSHNIFMEPLVFEGKLTLDAVKIDCSDFFQNDECN